MTKQKIFTAVAIICAAAAPEIFADDNLLRTDRYTLTQLVADSAQTDPLSTIVQTEFPAQIETVGDAVAYLLHRSGYELLRTDEIIDALKLPLPRTHRQIGPIDLRTALRTLVGPSWILQENKLVRLIWFVLAEQMQDPEPPQGITAALDSDNPQVAEPSPPQVDDDRQWLLQPNETLRSNLDDWSDQVNWTLQWNSRHDYEIYHQSSYRGTFFEAVQSLLEHYEHAPVPLTASFYAGNSVLVIEPYHARSQVP